MALSSVAMQTQVFAVPPSASFPGTVDPAAANHQYYDWNNCRANLNPSGGTVSWLGISLDAAGDTIYLPFTPDEISSLILPDPAAAGCVTKFLTASLSGCKFFVDTITGSSDLVVYHANAKQHAPAGHLSGTHPTLETPAATNMLDGLYATAQNYYSGAPHNFQLNQAASLAKPRYNRAAQMLVAGKTDIGHSHVEFVGGTLVAGFVSGGNWEFYFQTFGDLEYDRSFFKPKFWTDGKHKTATNWRVIESGRFYP